MEELLKGRLIATNDFTIIIHYVLAITVLNQLGKQAADRAGSGNVGECNWNFNSVSSNGQIGFVTFTLRCFTRGTNSIKTHQSDSPEVYEC